MTFVFVVLLIASSGAAVLGLLFLSEVTTGVGLIAGACWLGILARIVQAGSPAPPRNITGVVCVLCLSALVSACGNGPTSPNSITEAQVSSNGAWRGTFGERGTVGGQSGVGQPFLIGPGRQCADAEIVSGTTTTVRVGVDSMTLHATTNRTGRVCGEGLIR